jgi:hypothetical protein
MLVKVQSVVIKADASRAAKQLGESISFKAKGIDGPYTACNSISGGGTSCTAPGVNSGRGGPSYPRL